VQVGVEVALQRQVADELLASPGGPVVGGEDDVGVVPEELDRLLQVAGPDAGIADLRAAGPAWGFDWIELR
jgi:hypothetical protein